MLMKKIAIALLVLAICLLVIGVGSFISFQTTVPQVQPAVAQPASPHYT